MALPAPPPHTIIPVEIVEEPAAPPAPPLPAPSVPSSPRRRVAKPEKPAEKPVDKPDPAAVPIQPAAPVPAPPLQMTADVEGMETAIRKTMTQAKNDLDRTASQPLNAERRAQHDTAKRFLQQAEDALKVKNLVFAEQLADKAVTLAAALAQK